MRKNLMILYLIFVSALSAGAVDLADFISAED